MLLEDKVLELLRLLRSLDKNIVYNGQNGRCFQIHSILRIAFPQAEPWYNGNHIISKIGGDYYDITGQVTNVVGYYELEDDAVLSRAPTWGNETFGDGR